MNKILIVHGWTYSLDGWQDVVSALKASGTEVELLRVPGLTDGTDSTWTLDGYTEWLKKEVEHAGRVTLIGHSNGGRIALSFCAKYPGMIDHLILIDSAGLRAQGLGVRVKRLIFGILAKFGKLISTSNKLRSLLYRVAREKDYNNASIAMRKTMANMIGVDLRPLLKDIRVPTLIIWGTNDQSTPLHDGEELHRNIADSKLVVIPGARHSPHKTHPETVAAAILEFTQ